MRLLIVEDEASLGRSLQARFTDLGYAVDLAPNGIDGAHLGATEPYDAVILDLGLPDKPGLAVLREWRAAGHRVPVLILTARDGWQNKVEGLEAGADDYLVKPFDTPELLARVRALLRRTGGWASATLNSGPYALDTGSKQLQVSGVNIDLTSYEYRVLEYLLTHAGKVISKSELSEHLYSEETERDSNVIEVFIRRLRQKLDPEATINPITTLRGSGYRWDLPRA